MASEYVVDESPHARNPDQPRVPGHDWPADVRQNAADRCPDPLGAARDSDYDGEAGEGAVVPPSAFLNERENLMTKKGLSFAAVDEGNCTADLDLVLAPTDTHPRGIAVSRIVPNPYQARTTFDVTELAAVIEQHGFQSRLRVRPHPNGGGRFQLVYGERRLRAAVKAGLTVVPCDVSEHTDQEMKESGLLENLQRTDLAPLEEAHAFRTLIDEDGYSERTLATRLGKDRGYINNRLALLKQPKDVQAMVAARPDTLKSALLVASLPEEKRARIIQDVVDDKLPYTEVKRVVALLQSVAPMTPARVPPASYPKSARDLKPGMLSIERQLDGWASLVEEGKIAPGDVIAAIEQMQIKANKVLRQLAE